MNEEQSPLTSAAEQTAFDLQNGTIYLFTQPAEKKAGDYTFWGNLKTPDGELNVVRLWEFTSKGQVRYYRGHAAATSAEFKGLAVPTAEKHPGSIILFTNQPGATEKQAPHFTGKYYLSDDYLLLALWQRNGPKGIYYSGRITIPCST